MNPNTGISPQMDNNEALRRLLNIYMDGNGNPRPGAPGGPLQGTSLGTVIRVVAAGPYPTPARLLVAADDNRIGGLMRNLDATLTIWYGSSPNITDQTGATLNAGESTPVNIRGPLYVYTLSGAPLVEFVPVLDT